MQLVYLWVENYGIYHNVDFNFTPQYEFKYDMEMKELACLEHEGVIEKFFTKSFMPYANKDENQGKIANVTAVVGDNGTGKTTLLDMIRYYVVEARTRGKDVEMDMSRNNGSYLFIMEDQKNDLVLFTNTSHINIQESLKDKIKKCFLVAGDISQKDEAAYEEAKKERENIYYIYYDSLFDDRYGDSTHGRLDMKDISTNGLLKSDHKNRYETVHGAINENQLIVFFNEEMHRQIQFITKESKRYKEYIDFELPKNIYFRVQKLDYIKHDLEERVVALEKRKIWNIGDEASSETRLMISERNQDIQDMMDTYGLASKVIDKFGKYKVFNGADHIYLGILLRLIHELCMEEFKGKYAEEVKKVLEKLADREEQIEDLYELLNEFIQDIEVNKEITIRMKKYEYGKFVEYINKHSELFNKCFNAALEQFYIPVKDEQKEFYLQQFYSLYSKTATWFNYLSFSWPLSTGERTFLNLFARFYSTIKNKKLKVGKDVCIMIDEADMALHPKWQQRYIHTLFKFLTGLYKKKNIQLFITTHSPIILSDIPKQHIIYLEKEDGKVKLNKRTQVQTFGSNIYTLYNDSFYFEKDERGVMGEVANGCMAYVKEKLEELKGELSAKGKVTDKETLVEEEALVNEQMKQYKDLIEYIGEPIIKAALYKRYNEVESLVEQKYNHAPNEKVEQLMASFKALDDSEKVDFIQSIINSRKGDR